MLQPSAFSKREAKAVSLSSREKVKHQLASATKSFSKTSLQQKKACYARRRPQNHMVNVEANRSMYVEIRRKPGMLKPFKELQLPV